MSAGAEKTHPGVSAGMMEPRFALEPKTRRRRCLVAACEASPATVTVRMLRMVVEGLPAGSPQSCSEVVGGWGGLAGLVELRC